MGHSKLHHYVPQFYLRYFATDKNKKLISLYNLNNKLFIENAPIRKQAREKNLYGEDDLIEKELSQLEFYSSKILERLLEVIVPPPQDSPYFTLLKKYILYQSMRTVKAGTEIQNLIQNSTGELFKIMSRNDPSFKDLVARFENPIFVSLDMVERGLSLMEYLDCKILINETNLPFITSDNPVATYNHYCEIKKVKGGLGWAVKGFQVFFPLSPFIMIIFFDRFVYNCGTKKSLRISVTNTNDIKQLNILQYFSSNSQLFFSQNISKQYIQDIVEKNSAAKQAFRHTTSTKEHILPTGERSISFLSSSIEPNFNLTLSFLRITKLGKKFIFESEYSCPRHDSLSREVQKRKIDWSD